MRLGQMNLYFGVLNVEENGIYLRAKCGVALI
jgi:hypothetical protein